jgi:sigma-54 dependent transcriptional regulator, acetoin dehydrogenase operon transcriptional activator AcoR
MSSTPLARARRRPDELDRPIASALLLDEAHQDLIAQSHQRCASIGLSRIEAPDYSALGRPDLAETLARNRRLYTHAAPVMEMLYEQIVNTQSMVVLTDSCGTIIHSIGDDDFLAKASKVALQPGVNWSESSKGTNGMGTALMNEAPTLVHGEEHFMHANHFLTCSAAPIFDPRGNILGVLDVTGDHRRYHQHTMGLVKMSARMIENHWLSDDFRNVMRLHLHSRVEFLGTLMEGLLAVSRDGRIVGANRTALDHLGFSGAAVRMHSVTSLFGTSVGALVDHFRSPLAAPLALSLPNGTTCHVRARFNWATWYGLGDPLGPATGATAVAAEAAAAPAPAAPAAASPPGVARLPTANRNASGLRFLDTGDAQMKTLLGKVRKVIDRDIAILVLGETGTGKELLARAIHQDSERARMPFVAVNCASIPETLIEAELFGYEDGAFTGARRKGAIGKIVQANGGTLFLDEIGDMPLALQARLLRVLQERQVVPLGGHKPVAVDVALVSATHRDLHQMIEDKAFREDLYYRLNGLVVKMPPLRERSDLRALVSRMFGEECSGLLPTLAPDVLELFLRYHWPGNLRQLSNVLRTAAVMAAGEPTITRDHLSDDFLDDCQRSFAKAVVAAEPPVAVAVAAAAPAATGTLEEVEVEAIRRAVQAAGGNISEASKRLGISRNTIYRKLRWNAAA